MYIFYLFTPSYLALQVVHIGDITLTIQLSAPTTTFLQRTFDFCPELSILAPNDFDRALMMECAVYINKQMDALMDACKTWWITGRCVSKCR
jgi:hypothetical protein